MAGTSGAGDCRDSGGRLRRRLPARARRRHALPHPRCPDVDHGNQMGSGAGHGGTPILASLVRDDILRDLTYTGRIFSAQEAMSYGLATRICDDPRAAAFEVAREIAGKSPMRSAPPSACSTICPSIRPGAARQIRRADEADGGPNQQEAVRANLEKRAPRFADADNSSPVMPGLSGHPRLDCENEQRGSAGFIATRCSR